LGDEYTRAAGQCDLGFEDRGHCSDRRDAGVFQATASAHRRQAEREGHRIRPQIMHHVEFRGPVVVVIARLPEANAVVFGLSGQRGRVRVELCRRARTGLRRKQIDAQWTRRQLPRRDDAFGERIRRRRPAAMKPRPPAFVAAAASSGVDGPPAIGATITGTSRSAKFSRFKIVDFPSGWTWRTVVAASECGWPLAGGELRVRA
jgi:hypothetical protein